MCIHVVGFKDLETRIICCIFWFLWGTTIYRVTLSKKKTNINWRDEIIAIAKFLIEIPSFLRR